MISEELENIINDIKKQGKMSFLESATEEQISQFEESNNIVFPKQYIEWLLYSDGGELFLPAGVQFYGVNQKPIIDVNDNDRPNNNYIVIGALSTGDPVIFEKGSEKISIYNQEAERIETDEIYENFFDFLRNLHSLLGIGD